MTWLPMPVRKVVVCLLSLNSVSSLTSTTPPTRKVPIPDSETGIACRELSIFLFLFSSNWISCSPTAGGQESDGRGSNGGVWEWTTTVFDTHEGLVPTNLFTGYSADFFDTKHQVVVCKLFASFIIADSCPCSSEHLMQLFPGWSVEQYETFTSTIILILGWRLVSCTISERLTMFPIIVYLYSMPTNNLLCICISSI